MNKDFSGLENSNTTDNFSIHEISDPLRRKSLLGGLGATMGALFRPLGATGTLSAISACATSAATHETLLSFSAIPVSTSDKITVAEGYNTQIFAAWGEPVGVAGNMPEFKMDASNSAADQAVQMGMHHDGLHYFPINGSIHGLLVMNHEYTDDGLLHKDGINNWNQEKVKKSQAAHGVSVIEILFKGNAWEIVRPSRYARRITANTPMQISGPASGHPLMKTTADPDGVQVLGTFNNCASGITPWGTYLTCEENFMLYFKEQTLPDAHNKRWGMKKGSGFFRWDEFDERFDTNKHPNEPNRFGWIVEFDPFNPQAIPVKRTALGRATHEGATIAVTGDGRAVVYSGEDARFEYIYKFVSRDRIVNGGASANSTLLDHGTLYVARFNADFTGEWLPLVFGQAPLTPANGFSDQGEVVIKTRQASDLLGATKMDRPEWIAVDKKTNQVYCALTNNTHRGKDDNPGKDAANPHINNTMGQIIRWQEQNDFDSTRFTWSHFVLAGSPENQRDETKGNIRGDVFACPDGLFIDPRGVLWIETDMSSGEIGKGDYQYMGNNALLAADTKSGEIRRFLTAPNGAEITGASMTPDNCNLFVNIQHPGEDAKNRGNPAHPDKISNWPYGGRPRSATIIIRKNDDGIIGT